MTIKTLSELHGMNYNVDNIIAIRQTQKAMSFFSCVGRPKLTHLLLYLDSCSGQYTLKDGTKLFAKSGDIVYCPLGSEYTVSFFDFANSESSTIGINFMICDSDNSPFVLADEVCIINADNANYYSLFYKTADLSHTNPMSYSAHKSALYRILTELTEFERRTFESKYSIISKGIAYLEDEANPEKSIKEISEMCNVSEIYFRKLFKKYSGMSPNEYKINSKIIKAKRYLQSDISVSEVAERSGFSDVSYFVKVFREKTGITPLQYRKKLK